MKTVTVEQGLKWGPCYSEDEVRRIAGDKQKWNALEILDLDIPAVHRLWVVSHEELIDAPILHEFGCRVADWVLAYVEKETGIKPHFVSLSAICDKRRWLRGEITNEELERSRKAAYDVACAARAAARAADADAAYAAYAAADAAYAAADAAYAAAYAAYDTAYDTARYASYAAHAAYAAADAAADSARAAVCAAAVDTAYMGFVVMLRKMLQEAAT